MYVLVYIITLMQGDKTEKKEKPGRRGNGTERQREAGKEDAKSWRSGMKMHDGERMERRKWESDREALEQIKVKLSAFTYLDERF